MIQNRIRRYLPRYWAPVREVSTKTTFAQVPAFARTTANLNLYEVARQQAQAQLAR